MNKTHLCVAAACTTFLVSSASGLHAESKKAFAVVHEKSTTGILEGIVETDINNFSEKSLISRYALDVEDYLFQTGALTPEMKYVAVQYVPAAEGESTDDARLSTLSVYDLIQGTETTLHEICPIEVTDLTFDWGTNTLYAVAEKAIYTIDTSNGEINTFASFTSSIYGIAADGKGMIYAIGEDGEGGNAVSKLYTLNTMSRTLTPKVELTGFNYVDGQPLSLEFDANGILYLSGKVTINSGNMTYMNNAIGTIDIKTGIYTLIHNRLAHNLVGISFLDKDPSLSEYELPKKNEENLVKVKTIYHYGDLNNNRYNTTTITGIKRYFYDSSNKLSRLVEYNVMLADDETTREVETIGQEIAKNYHIYTYNNQGLLRSISSRHNALISDYDLKWDTIEEEESYTYTGTGKMASKTTASSKHSYTWDKQNMIKEVVRNLKGTWTSTTTYSDFIAANKPSKALIAKPQVVSFGKVYNYDTYITYTYNDRGDILEQNEYELSSSTHDATNDNIITSFVAKENIATQIAYTYNENGRIIEQCTKHWNSSRKELIPNIRVSYTYEEDGGIWAQTQVYSITTGQWANYGTPTRTYETTLDGETAPTDLSISIDKDGENKIILSASVPTKKGDSPYYVYRNGTKVGEATSNGSELTFTESKVANGEWEYFIAQGDGNISEIVSYTLNTELSAPRMVRVAQNGKNSDGEYLVRLAWKAPKNSLTLIGYNVYDNIKIDNDHALPVNDKVFITANNYILTYPSENAILDHNYIVEAVYAIGKARSEIVSAKLSDTPIEESTVQSIEAIKCIYNLGEYDEFPTSIKTGWDYSGATEKTVYFYGPDNKRNRAATYTKIGETWEVKDYTIFKQNEDDSISGEIHTDATGKILYTVDYTSFANGNYATAILYGSTADSYRYIEASFDNANRITQKKCYTLANPTISEDNKVNGEKGELICSEGWYYYDTLKDSIISYTYKDETTQTLVSQLHKFITVEFNGESATNLQRGESNKTNCIQLNASAPEFTDVTAWQVFRNGVHIGEATLNDDNTLIYTDTDISEGTWDYFIQATDAIDTLGENISNALTLKVALEISAPSNVRTIHNGINVKNLHEVKFAWDKPETDLEVLGYNLYLDGAETPSNKELIQRTNFTRTWPMGTSLTHTICIEAVYNAGSAKSAPMEFSLDSNKLPEEISKNYLRHISGTYGDVLDEYVTGLSKKTIYFYDANNNPISSIYTMITEGKETPCYLYVYEYNDKQQLTSVRRRQYGLYDGYDFCWNEGRTQESYTYDENGNVAVETTENSTIEYTYEGNNIVRSKTISTAGNLTSAFVYMDFLENANNLPLRAISNGRYSSAKRIYEYTYDEESLNILSARTYKIEAGSEITEGDYIIDAQKGTPDIEELYTYDENDQLVYYEKNRWNTSQGKFLPYLKTEYTQLADGVKEQSYSTMDKGVSWQRASTSNFYQDREYKGSAPTNLIQIKDETLLPTHVALCADAPADASANSVWNVFCNGICIGQTSDLRDGKIYYTDKNGKIGEWHYFIQDAKADTCEYGVFSSNCITVNIEVDLPKVDEWREVINGIDESTGTYCYKIEWDAPKSDYEIIGYNIFIDIPTTTNHPAPSNASPFTETEYTINWDSDTNLEHTIFIQTVYSCGKASGKAHTITLKQTTVGIDNISDESRLVIKNNLVLVRGGYKTLEVFAPNGTKIGEWDQQSEIDLSHLIKGSYIIRLQTNDNVIVEKVNIK